MDISKVAKQIKRLHNSNRTLIVGIDGLGGAGKSTFSEKLYKMLNDENYNTVLFHIDDFIHPRAVRYNDNYTEWECYYNLQWRYDYFVNEIITPIKNGADFNDKAELYDKDNDTYFLAKSMFMLEALLL